VLTSCRQHRRRIYTDEAGHQSSCSAQQQHIRLPFRSCSGALAHLLWPDTIPQQPAMSSQQPARHYAARRGFTAGPAHGVLGQGNGTQCHKAYVTLQAVYPRLSSALPQLTLANHDRPCSDLHSSTKALFNLNSVCALTEAPCMRHSGTTWLLT
jgi:hypothetical protein